MKFFLFFFFIPSKDFGQVTEHGSHEGKSIAIQQHIGKMPVFGAGNSDGYYAMLEYTSKGDGPRLGMIIHHTDSVREYAFGKDSPIGHLSKALDGAAKNKWDVVNMKTNWKVIIPFEVNLP